MEDENKTIQSHPATSTTTLELPNSEPADDPPPPATADDGVEPKNKNPEEDPETGRESKRRKLCPSALEKCEAIIINSCSNSSNCFSFALDPKFSFGVSTPEVTPKFGSFNLATEAAAAAVSSEIEVKSTAQEGGKKDDDEVKEKRKLLEILGSGDDGISADYFEEGSNVFL